MTIDELEFTAKQNPNNQCDVKIRGQLLSCTMTVDGVFHYHWINNIISRWIAEMTLRSADF
jgi:hypothetical protein